MPRGGFVVLLLAVVGSQSLSVMTSAASPEADAAVAFDQLIAEAWEFDMAGDPAWATSVGDHRFNDRLADVSPDSQTRRLAAKRQFRARLETIDDSQLSTAKRIDYAVFRRLLEDEIAEGGFKSYQLAITGRSGFHIEFPEIRRSVPLNTIADYENYIARLRAFEVYVDQHIALMREGMAAGRVLPTVVLEGFETSLSTHILQDPRESLFFEVCRQFPATIPAAEQERIIAAAAAAIEESVVPGYRKFLEFMRTEYVPASRPTIAAAELPDGRAFYRHRVRRYTTLATTPEEVHRRGLEEVRRIRSEMEAVIERTDHDGDFAAFVEHLRTSPEFYAETPEQLLKEVSLVLKEMDGRLPALFGRLPRMPYGIRPVPDFIAPRTTTAYYMRPAGDGTRAGFYYVNTYDLKSRPLYEIEALSLHEAVPGHHLQIALQQELSDLPNFRRYAGFTVFVEGWALYAERLGGEVGFYQDPYRDFGRLTYEMWRACRLVVDTGMHYFGWSRAQAIDFMAENTALSMHNIQAEVDRYIAWPGQALAYKTGELKIRELRSAAEQRLGSRFDIREFHDVVLGSGAVPLDVLEANVTRWIEEKAAS